MNESLDAALRRLAREHDDYDAFRKAALDATPAHLRPSIGPHLLEFYVEFRYPEATR